MKSLSVYKLNFILVPGQLLCATQILREKQAATRPVLDGNLFYSLTINHTKCVFKIQNFETHLLEGTRLLRKRAPCYHFHSPEKISNLHSFMINRHNL